ncbi:MAG: hypothetical protein AMXMBFR51_21050 [Ignavibacteriota bacterium]
MNKSKIKDINSKSYFFVVCFKDDDNNEVTVEISAQNEAEAWELFSRYMEQNYSDKSWYYSGKFLVKEKE